MPKFSDNAATLIDEMFVAPPPDSKIFLEVFSQLSSGLSNKKWKEIKSRIGISEELQIMIETALELSTSKKTVLFRKHNGADDTLTAIWFASVLRKAKTQIIRENIREFSGLNSVDIRNIALMSVDERSPTFIADFLAEKFGIILIIEQGFSGMKLDGVVTKLAGSNPVIGMSLRYARYNNFWFTLLHELSHITLHDEELNAVIYDDLDEKNISDTEMEANRLAADSIIPRYLFNKSPALRSNSDVHIYALAQQSEVHPILVAGAIQHYTNNYRNFVGLVNSIDVRKILGVRQ